MRADPPVSDSGTITPKGRLSFLERGVSATHVILNVDENCREDPLALQTEEIRALRAPSCRPSIVSIDREMTSWHLSRAVVEGCAYLARFVRDLHPA